MAEDYLDKLKKKRQEQAEKKEKEQSNKESLDAVNSVGNEVTRQAAKSRTTTQPVEIKNDNLAKSNDVQEVVDSINRMNVTTFMASKDNWTTIVEEMAEAAERIKSVVDGLNGGKIEKSFADAVKNLQDVVKQVKGIKIESDTELKSGITSLIRALEELNTTPIVNVPAPIVNVDAPTVNLTPIKNLLQQLLDKPEKESFEFEGYKAQDLDDQESFQYVGFVNPTGAWYIIENDVEGNSMRYKFGIKYYKTGWKNRVQSDYKLLNEAIDAIKA